MTGLLLAAVLSQTPSLAVVTVRRTAASAADGTAMAAQVTALLVDAGIEPSLTAEEAAQKLSNLGVKDPGVCQGRKACVTEFGRQLGVKVVVTVSLARLKSDVGVSLEAVRTDDATALANESVLLVANAKLEGNQLAAFVARLREALGLKAPEVPKKVVLTPQPIEPQVVVTPPPVAQRSHAPSVALAASAGVAAVTAVVLTALALSARADLERQAGGASVHTYAEAQSLASRTNALATTAIGLGGAAALFGVGAVVLW